MSSNVFMNNQLERIADYIDAGKAGGSLTIDLTGFGDMQGATAGQAGVHGLVPAPAAGDENKVLTGAGTWIDAGSGGELGDLEDVTITSPTSGESLKYDGAKWVNGNVTAELPDFIEETSGNIVTVEAAERPAKSLKFAINPVQSGSGDPSPENIRPISGWTECNVTRTGKNLLPITKWFREGYTYTQSGITVTFINEGKIKVSGTNASSVNTDIYLSRAATNFNSLYVKNGNYTISAEGLIRDINIVTSGGGNNGFPYTLLSRVNLSTTGNVTVETKPFNYFIIRVSGGATVDATINLQLEKGNIATTYKPYTGQDYTIHFPSEAGTVYGGMLDVTTGTLTVNKASIASYDGETLPGAWISDRDVYAEGTTPTTGAQVVYDLDTPITYQLTPTEVQMLIGTNNIWADTGEVKELKYIPQTYNDLLEEVTSGGGLPDYSNIITSGNYNTYDGFTYTAAQDCFVYIMIGCASQQSYPNVIINNNNIGYIWGHTSGVESLITIPLRSGDSLEITAVNAGDNWSEKYTIFGM